MKILLSSIILIASINVFATQEKSKTQAKPSNVKCIQTELKKEKSLEQAYQTCSVLNKEKKSEDK